MSREKEKDTSIFDVKFDLLRLEINKLHEHIDELESRVKNFEGFILNTEVDDFLTHKKVCNPSDMLNIIRLTINNSTKRSRSGLKWRESEKDLFDQLFSDFITVASKQLQRSELAIAIKIARVLRELGVEA